MHMYIHVCVYKVGGFPLTVGVICFWFGSVLWQEHESKLKSRLYLGGLYNQNIVCMCSDPFVNCKAYKYALCWL